VYSLEYTDIKKVFFMPHCVCCCTNTNICSWWLMPGKQSNVMKKCLFLCTSCTNDITLFSHYRQITFCFIMKTTTLFKRIKYFILYRCQTWQLLPQTKDMYSTSMFYTTSGTMKETFCPHPPLCWPCQNPLSFLFPGPSAHQQVVWDCSLAKKSHFINLWNMQ
jgi:hypothetical protein